MGLLLVNIDRISEFVVSGVKHCGKAALRPSGIKLVLLTLAPMGACGKSYSRNLNHNIFTISTLGFVDLTLKYRIFQLIVKNTFLNDIYRQFYLSSLPYISMNACSDVRLP